MKMKTRVHEKNVEFADLVKSFPTNVESRKSASIQLRTSLSKFEGWTDSFQRPDFPPQPLELAADALCLRPPLRQFAAVAELPVR